MNFATFFIRIFNLFLYLFKRKQILVLPTQQKKPEGDKTLE